MKIKTVFFILLSCIIIVLLFSFFLIRDTIRIQTDPFLYAKDGQTITLREVKAQFVEIGREPTAANMPDYSDDLGFSDEFGYCRLLVTGNRIIDFPYVDSRGKEQRNVLVYLIVEAKIQDLYYCPESFKFKEDETIRMITHFANTNTIGSKVPLIETGREYFCAIKPFVLSSQEETIPVYAALPALADYTFSPTIYKTIPIDDSGYVIVDGNMFPGTGEICEEHNDLARIRQDEFMPLYLNKINELEKNARYENEQ